MDDIPQLKVVLKGELLKRTTQRYPDVPFAEIEAIHALQAVARAINSSFTQKLAAYGLSEGKFYVICYLFAEELMGHDKPGPSGIAENVGVTRATVTGLLDGLERDGFLCRHSATRDRRALTIALTDKARQFMDEFVPAIVGSLAQTTAALTAAERQTLIELLGKIEVGESAPI